VQLLICHCDRILLVLAADLEDNLAVLEMAIEMFRSLKLAMFLDPDHPRMGMELLLSECEEDRGKL